jgi:IS1 family transposase
MNPIRRYIRSTQRIIAISNEQINFFKEQERHCQLILESLLPLDSNYDMTDPADWAPYAAYCNRVHFYTVRKKFATDRIKEWTDRKRKHQRRVSQFAVA